VGHVQVLDRSGQAIDAASRLEESAVEQHAHGLNRVERHTLRPLQHLFADFVREAGHQPVEQLFHGCGSEWLQEHGREIPLTGSP
jgi:hypothetical protein